MIGATVCWSLAGLIVRHLSVNDSWQILHLRSVFSTLALSLLIIVLYRRGAVDAVLRCGWAGWLSGLMFAVMTTFFILAVTRTTVANTLTIMALAPCIGALGAWLMLGEHVRLRTWATIACAVIGVALMFADAFGSGGMVGNLLALGIPLAYGANLVVLRKAGRHVDMLPAALIGSALSALLALPFAYPLTFSATDVQLIALMGVVQHALGCALFVMAARHINAAELGLIGLLETVLAPLWVWLAIGEHPAGLALVGAGMVIVALAVNETLSLFAARRVVTR